MVGSGKYIQSEEISCLFCDKPVERGLVKDYKGITVWICANCIMEGRLGSLMATAIMDKLHIEQLQDSPHYRSEVLSEIERCVITTQASFYRDLLHHSFHPSPHEESKRAHVQEVVEEHEEPQRVENESKEKSFPDESEVLDFLESWRSIEDIQNRFQVDYQPLLEMLNRLFLRGYIFKRGSPQNPQYCNTLIT